MNLPPSNYPGLLELAETLCGLDDPNLTEADRRRREVGMDWPDAQTMIGMERLRWNISAVCDVVQRDTPGDIVETGCWRGGSAGLMAATLETLGDTERKVWAFDSFEGFRAPSPDFPQDSDGPDYKSHNRYLAAPFHYFQKTQFLIGESAAKRLHPVKGYFDVTVPHASVEQISLLRTDGDTYEATMIVLEQFWPRLSDGGLLFVDDWSLPKCAQAVLDFGLNPRYRVGPSAWMRKDFE